MQKIQAIHVYVKVMAIHVKKNHVSHIQGAAFELINFCMSLIAQCNLDTTALNACAIFSKFDIKYMTYVDYPLFNIHTSGRN